MRTDEVIKRLAADTPAVRRLRPPWVRAVFWLAIALPYVAAVVRGKLMMVDPSHTLADPRFMIEQATTFATALTAAVAAFCTIVPGFDRRILLLPMAPLALWIASVGHGCVQDWLRFGADGLAIRPDWECLPSATIIGIVPAIAMVAMLRRGAPLYPRLTLGPIDIQGSHRESVLIHCTSDQLIRSAAHGEAVRAQRPAVGAYR